MTIKVKDIKPSAIVETLPRISASGLSSMRSERGSLPGMAGTRRSIRRRCCLTALALRTTVLPLLIG